MMLSLVDQRIFAHPPAPSLAAVIDAMATYAEAELSRGTRLNCITRHMLGLAMAVLAPAPSADPYVDAARRGAAPKPSTALRRPRPELELA